MCMGLRERRIMEKFQTNWDNVFIMFYPGQGGSLISAILTLYGKNFYHHNKAEIKNRNSNDNHFDLNVLETFLHSPGHREKFYQSGKSLIDYAKDINPSLLEKYRVSASELLVSNRLIARSTRGFDDSLLPSGKSIAITANTTEEFSLMCNQAVIKVDSVSGKTIPKKYDTVFESKNLGNLDTEKIKWVLNDLERQPRMKNAIDNFISQHDAVPIRTKDIFYNFEKVLDLLDIYFEVDYDPAYEFYENWRSKQEIVETEYWKIANELFEQVNGHKFEI